MDIAAVAKRSGVPASAPAANHSECPTFRRLLRAAGAGKLAGAPGQPAVAGRLRRAGPGSPRK